MSITGQDEFLKSARGETWNVLPFLQLPKYCAGGYLQLEARFRLLLFFSNAQSSIQLLNNTTTQNRYQYMNSESFFPLLPSKNAKTNRYESFRSLYCAVESPANQLVFFSLFLPNATHINLVPRRYRSHTCTKK